jgi:hypothetical protein
MWHMQVQPQYASLATPAFLFIYSALDNMLKVKKGLVDIGLWDPPTQKGKEQRQDHDLWRRYCDNMVRVEAARQDLPALRQFSLLTDLQPMWDYVKRTEEQYRTAGQPARPGGR